MKIRESVRRGTVWIAAAVAGAAVILALAVVAVGRGGAADTDADTAAGGSRGSDTGTSGPPASPTASAFTHPTSASPSGAAPHARGAKKGQQAPPFSGVSTTGRQLDVPTGRIAVLYFFAPGCYTCGPHLKRLADYQRRPHDHDIDMVGVNIDPPSEPVVEKFRRTYHATNIPIIKHADTALARRYHANYLGTTLVLDADGTVRWRGSAPRPDELHRIVARLRHAA